MKKFIHYCMIIIPLSQPVYGADEIAVIPNFFISTRNFEYSVSDGGVKGNINSLGLGITGTYQRFYLDFSGETTPSATDESTINLLPSEAADFRRTDVATSFGYAVNESISTFVGYKYGKTTITELYASPVAGSKISLQAKGLFVGAGGGWAVSDWGLFSFSAAYARMEALYQDIAVDSAKGDASGTSLGIKWKASITDNFSYDLSIIRHDYYYKDFDKLTTDISEQILSFRAGLSYRF